MQCIRNFWAHVSYVLVERNTLPTEFNIYDDYLLYLSNGGSDMQAFEARHGLCREDIDSLVFVPMGMRGVDFRMVFQVWMTDVSKRTGFGSANNLYLTYKCEFGIAPGERRQKICKEGDVGRYKV